MISTTQARMLVLVGWLAIAAAMWGVGAFGGSGSAPVGAREAPPVAVATTEPEPTAPDPAPAPAPEPEGERLLFLGDSYTAGEKVEPKDTWHALLVEKLRSEGVEVHAEVVAVSGWRVEDLARGIELEGPTGPFALAFVFIGSNDHFARLPPIAFRSELDRLVSQVLALVGGEGARLILLGMPDWTVTPYGSRFELPPSMVSDIDAYNDVIREIAAARGASFVDLLTLSRAEGKAPENFVDDGLHASPLLAERWAALALPATQKTLTSPPAPAD